MARITKPTIVHSVETNAASPNSGDTIQIAFVCSHKEPAREARANRPAMSCRDLLGLPTADRAIDSNDAQIAIKAVTSEAIATA